MDNLANIFQNQENITGLMFLASFLGGVIASISPCSLAVLPIIIGYIGGYSKESPLKVATQMFFFILGMSVIFTVIGLICALTGKVLGSFTGGYFAVFIASILLIMGLKLTSILDFEMPILIKQLPTNNNSSSIVYPFILGSLFALAGSPCSTPILASIMAIASFSEKLLPAVLMLFLFALGQGVILIITAVFTSSIKKMRSFASISDGLLKFSGLLLICASLYLFYKIFHPFFI